MKTNTTIKIIDISSNTSLTCDALMKLGDIFETNRSIEYFGLAKLGLNNDHAKCLFNQIGKFPFPEDQVENQLAELKKRDVIVEKNKKLKASKKPEEPVPTLDSIEQITKKNDAGETIQVWVTSKNPQVKHFNFCMNDLNDDLEPCLSEVLNRTPDDFGVTVSSNKMSEEAVESLHEKIRKWHGLNVDLLLQQAEAAGQEPGDIKFDEAI